MSSPKEDGTAVATEQLGSLSLGESVERKDDDTAATTKNGTTPTKLCSACETKSDTLMKCRACKCVWYCDKKCQNKHWKEHKRECKRIKKELDKRGGKLDLGTELDVGPLGKVPPREECPICMQVLPLHERLHIYFACCGKTICRACDYRHEIKSDGRRTCAFCRTPLPDSDENLARLRKRAERKDSAALLNMALGYGFGDFGLQVDQAKCIALLRESADLDFPPAQYQLGKFHRLGEMGLEQNEEEGLKYYEKAAEGGDLDARHNLGCLEGQNDDLVASMRHWRLSAAGGDKDSMDGLIAYFENGLLQHGDLAETLQVFYRSRAEMKSEGRDQFIKHLKKTGEYEAEYDL